METIWCIASPFDWLNVVYTAVAIAVVHFLIEVLVYSTYTIIIIGGLSDVKHHYFISPWSGQDNYLACLYHYGPISPWWLQPQEFFFKQVVITSKMCLAILCIYVYVCVCADCVFYTLFRKLHHQYTSGWRVWCGWYVSNGDCEQRDGSLWLLLLQCKADLIISIVMLSVLQHACECWPMVAAAPL